MVFFVISPVFKWVYRRSVIDFKLDRKTKKWKAKIEKERTLQFEPPCLISVSLSKHLLIEIIQLLLHKFLAIESDSHLREAEIHGQVQHPLNQRSFSYLSQVMLYSISFVCLSRLSFPSTKPFFL